MRRCGWVQGGHEADISYHDHEWGVPVHDEHRWFEFLILEGAQAGLSWSTILRKRGRYREVYESFDPTRVARFDAARQAQLLLDAGIVRNRLKIAASVTNAQRFLAVQDEFGSFDAYIWRFVDGHPLQPDRGSLAAIPARTPESDALSKDLRQRGFKFVGSTICYALMQAAGLVNDHETGCFRHAEVRRLR
ncbi:MAG: DNA-3-methyladenine glycosylase I [bacterium]|nr:DNA-3-methyladenine glycosylase I [bacterium]